MTASEPFDPAHGPPIGAVPDPGGGFRFRVWAPRARELEVVYLDRPRRIPLVRSDRLGYFEGWDEAGVAGERYWLRLDGQRRPDPTSRSQPDGSDGPSALVDPRSFGPVVRLASGLDLARTILYELHVGAFTDGGTFDAAIDRLQPLADTGITALELLPVPEGGGERGWGYGGVHQFAVRRAYGGPAGLRRFVDAAHRVGLAVLLDVVYNHWGPGAEFLEEFGPYFHPRASTPWGPTPNLIAAGSDEVRRYFFENARMWLAEFGVDGFRLDAVHEIYDRPPRHFWAEFSDACRAVGSRIGTRPALVAESDLNDVRILRPTGDGGWGIDAQWSDDFHHALHAAFTGERRGYYVDYGPLALLGRAFERPLLFEGQYSVSRDRRHGSPGEGIPPRQFVVFDQNHDQIGNRGDGARLTTLLPPPMVRVALALTLLAPYVPMLFMGEEYGETRPFYFFGDPPPAARARLAAGRMRHLRENGFETPAPDPSDPATFGASHLDWSRADSPAGRSQRAFVRSLLRLRADRPALTADGRVETRSSESERWIAVHRSGDRGTVRLVANLSDSDRVLADLPWPGPWRTVFDTEGAADRPGAPDGGPRGATLAARSLQLAERIDGPA